MSELQISCPECGSYSVTPTMPAQDGRCEYRCDDCGHYFVDKAKEIPNKHLRLPHGPRPPDRRLSVLTLAIVRMKIAALRGAGLKWREIEKDHYPGVPWGTLSRILHDPTYDPHKPDIRTALGLLPSGPRKRKA